MQLSSSSLPNFDRHHSNDNFHLLTDFEFELFEALIDEFIISFLIPGTLSTLLFDFLVLSMML